MVGLAVREVGESWRGRRSGAWESFSDDIFGQSLARVSGGAVVVLIKRDNHNFNYLGLEI